VVTVPGSANMKHVKEALAEVSEILIDFAGLKRMPDL